MDELVDLACGGIPTIALCCDYKTDIDVMRRHVPPNCRMSLAVEMYDSRTSSTCPSWTRVFVDRLPPHQRGWLRDVVSDRCGSTILYLPLWLAEYAAKTLPPAWFTDQTLYIHNSVGLEDGYVFAYLLDWIRAMTLRRLVYSGDVRGTTVANATKAQELFCDRLYLPRFLDKRSDWTVIGVAGTQGGSTAAVTEARVCPNLQVLFLGRGQTVVSDADVCSAMGDDHPVKAVYWSDARGSMNHSLVFGPHDCSLARNRMLCMDDLAREPPTGRRMYVDCIGGTEGFYPAVTSVYVAHASWSRAPPPLQRFPNITELRLSIFNWALEDLWPDICALRNLRALHLEVLSGSWRGLPECIEQLGQLRVLKVVVHPGCLFADTTVPASLYRLHRLVYGHVLLRDYFRSPEPLSTWLREVVCRNRTRRAMAAQLLILCGWVCRGDLPLPAELLDLVIQSA